CAYASRCSFVARAPPRSPLFPYTTLFRSFRHAGAGVVRAAGAVVRHARELRPRQCHLRFLLLHPAQALLDGFGREKALDAPADQDRKSTRLNSSHVKISYAVFCLKKKKKN